MSTVNDLSELLFLSGINEDIATAKETIQAKLNAAIQIPAIVEKTEPKKGDDDSTKSKYNYATNTSDGAMEAKKVEVPKEVYTHIDQRLKELKASIEEYDEKGFNDGGTLQSEGAKKHAVEALDKIKDFLDRGDEESMKHLTVYTYTLMGPILNLIPPSLILFIAKAK